MDKDGIRNLQKNLKAEQLPELSDSFLDNLKNEWRLFWHGIISDDNDEIQSDPFRSDRIQALTLDQIKQITRALSQDRKRLNQRIESVQKEIDSHTENLESQKLVGADTEPTLLQIQKIMDVGHQLSQQLEKVSVQISKFRKRESELKAQIKGAQPKEL